MLDVDLGPDRQLGERSLERRLAEARAEAEHASLVRGGDDGDVAPQTALVLVFRLQQVDPEVLTGPKVHLFSVEVEDDEERLARDLPLFLDRRPHSAQIRPETVSWFSAWRIRCSSCQRSALDSPRSTRSSSACASSSWRRARSSSISDASTASSTSASARSVSTLKKPGPVANSSTSLPVCTRVEPAFSIATS